jgi:hypothetical protein
MSILNPVKNTTHPTVYRKYEFPRVVISGTQICCGFRPCYLDNAKHYYMDQNGVPSPYNTVQQIVFGMCYFSAHKALHQYKDRKVSELLNERFRYIDITQVPGKELSATMYPGGGAVNYRHWVLDPNYGLLFTHTTPVATMLIAYLKENNLGEVVTTPNWVSKVTMAHLTTFIWLWNGNVPTPESAGIKDFPFDALGNPIAGRTNLRDGYGNSYFGKDPFAGETTVPTTDIQATAA